jgi:hypothetical protein
MNNHKTRTSFCFVRQFLGNPLSKGVETKHFDSLIPAWEYYHSLSDEARKDTCILFINLYPNILETLSGSMTYAEFKQFMLTTLQKNLEEVTNAE